MVVHMGSYVECCTTSFVACTIYSFIRVAFVDGYVVHIPSDPQASPNYPCIRVRIRGRHCHTIMLSNDPNPLPMGNWSNLISSDPQPRVPARRASRWYTD